MRPRPAGAPVAACSTTISTRRRRPSQGSCGQSGCRSPLTRPSQTCAASTRCATVWPDRSGNTRSNSRSFAPQTLASRSAIGIGLPSASWSCARLSARMSSVSVQCTSTAASPSARSPSSMRRARSACPASTASPSLNTSYLATFSTAEWTCSKLSSPGPYRSASFCTSWCAASRLPSTRSAKNASVRCPASPAPTRWSCAARRWAIHTGRALRSTGSTRTVTPARSSASNQALDCWARSSLGSCTRVTRSALRLRQ